MKNSYIHKKIIFKEKLAPNILRIKVEYSGQVKPGQFFMIRGWSGVEPLLSRAISVADYENEQISFLIEVKGSGTKLIDKLGLGDEISLLGPLGQGFNIESGKKIALVAGGIGIAPLLYLAKKMDGKVDLYAGFREKEYLVEEFKPYIDEVHIATDSGKTGHKGLVTDLISPDKYDLVITCGPMVMMKALAQICSGRVDLEMSLENNMACGIGACMGCTVETKTGMKTVCKNGPVFKESELIL